MAEPTASKVTIKDEVPTVLEPRPGADVTPTVGLSALTGQDTGKVTGSSGNDRATLFDLVKDKDQIIKLGDGDDVFVFRNNADGSNGAINGIVDGGNGEDHVFLAGSLADYEFSLRSDGSIKIHYVADADGDGAAVTFRGFETFTFRNISADGLTNYQNDVFSADALKALILDHVVI